jgi:GntR family transcriptional regulator
MLLRVDPDSATPIYRQIVDGMRVALVDGKLRAGDPLPSVRRLALDLGVHFNTVAQAYRTLAEEGWLEISARGGAEVKEREAPSAQAAAVPYRRRLDELVARLRADGVRPARLAHELRRIARALEGAE